MNSRNVVFVTGYRFREHVAFLAACKTISIQLVLLVIKKGEGYFRPFYFSFLCLTAATAAEATEATEAPIEAEPLNSLILLDLFVCKNSDWFLN